MSAPTPHTGRGPVRWSHLYVSALVPPDLKRWAVSAQQGPDGSAALGGSAELRHEQAERAAVLSEARDDSAELAHEPEGPPAARVQDEPAARDDFAALHCEPEGLPWQAGLEREPEEPPGARVRDELAALGDSAGLEHEPAALAYEPEYD